MTAAARVGYLRKVALTRAHCAAALADGFIVDPDCAAEASTELLLRRWFPWRRRKLTAHIMRATDAQRAGALDPWTLWRSAQHG